MHSSSGLVTDGHIAAQPVDVMFSHLPHLRAYARRLVRDQEALIPAEMQDKEMRLREFMTIGAWLNWTDKEMTSLLLREAFSAL